jgi:parallel beta-helix repeat protein
MKRIVPITMLMLLLMAMLSLSFNFKSTKAEWTGTVYIRANGSIDPPDAPIVTYDNVTYTLTSNIISTADGIVVERDNIIIDGAGYWLEGDHGSSYGIKLVNRTDVAIKNINIKKFWCGIRVYSSSNNIITRNNITNNGIGMFLIDSNNNKISGNNITNNFRGIELQSSLSNTISGNTFTNNGLVVWFSYQNRVENNTVNGRALVYLENVSNYKVADAGQVVLVRCNNITVEGLCLSGASVGIELFETNKSSIFRNSITNNDGGIVLLYHSLNNTIYGNNITINYEGIWLEMYSDYNSIYGNSITNNSHGIELVRSSNNSIYGNSITNNNYGIELGGSSNNSIYGNSITNNDGGIGLSYSSNYNSIYHNNFIDNARQVYIKESGPNVWDDVYPSGGNYWSNYTGVDLYSGPYQNEIGSDGIGDTPYIIDADNIDHYPLMAPFNAFQAGVWYGTAYNVDVISNSTVSDFKFNVDRKSISFNVTGDNGTVGFCRVAIPKSLLWANDGWTIFVDNQPITDYTKFEYENYTYLYFTYTHSTKTVTIKGTHVIPEYPSTTILTIFMLTTTVLVALTGNKRLKYRYNN